MNPSANGWIEKFGFLVKKEPLLYQDFDSMYKTLKKLGFVYGINVAIPEFVRSEHKLTEDEMAKVNLLTALYGTYKLQCAHISFEDFLEKVFSFYQDLKVDNSSFFHKILAGKKRSLN